MRLTAAGKFLLILVGLAVLGYAGWTYRNRLPISGLGGTADPAATPAAAPGSREASADAPTAASRSGVLAAVRQTGVLRVGMEPDAAPLHFINERKQEDGFDFRLAGRDREAMQSMAVLKISSGSSSGTSDVAKLDNALRTDSLSRMTGRGDRRRNTAIVLSAAGAAIIVLLGAVHLLFQRDSVAQQRSEGALRRHNEADEVRGRAKDATTCWASRRTTWR